MTGVPSSTPQLFRYKIVLKMQQKPQNRNFNFVVVFQVYMPIGKISPRSMSGRKDLGRPA